MEYTNLLAEYGPAMTEEQVAQVVADCRAKSVRNQNSDVYKLCYSTIDLTTLTECDSTASVSKFVKKAVDFGSKYPHIPNVASICVFPLFVDVVGLGVEGTDPSDNYVGLPATTQFNDGFSAADYDALVAKLFSGELTVSDDITAEPATAITVNYLGTVK